MEISKKSKTICSKCRHCRRDLPRANHWVGPGSVEPENYWWCEWASANIENNAFQCLITGKIKYHEYATCILANDGDCEGFEPLDVRHDTCSVCKEPIIFEPGDILYKIREKSVCARCARDLPNAGLALV